MEQEKQQEIIFKLSMFEQQMQQIQAQIEALEKGMTDLGSLNLGLDELKGKVGKEILAPLGRGVFINAKLASEDLTVDIGGKNFVKKSVPDTKKIIEEQIDKLSEVREELNKNLDNIGEEMNRTLEEFR